MDAIIARVLQRYSEVVPFRPRPPSGPTTEIGGKKYVLTDYSPFGGNELSDGGEGHARLIEVPSSGSKFKYLWAYDTDRKLVAAWRVTDGNEKAYGSAQQEMHHVVHLEKHGQLNRVTSGEFSHIEAEMRHREDENTKALKKWIEEEKTDYQATVDRLAREFFEHHVRPKLDKAVHDVKAGVIPLGFKEHPHPHASPELQRISYVVGNILTKDFTPEKVDAYLKTKGIDPDAPEHDMQASYWAVGDIRDATYDEYFPHRTASERVSYVKKEHGEYCVHSETNPDWNGGCYDTKAEANERLRQVEYFKHRGASDLVSRVVFRYLTGVRVRYAADLSLMRPTGAQASHLPADRSNGQP